MELPNSAGIQSDYGEFYNGIGKLFRRRRFICLLPVYMLCLFFSSKMTWAQQKAVAITMDDIEQRNAYLPEDFKTNMLDSIVSLQLPVTILVCEGRLFLDDTLKRLRNIEKWMAEPLITPGSHTYSHVYYSDTTFAFYTKDIERGLAISLPLAQRFGKVLKYFRFPFNCLGRDSMQHDLIRRYLGDKGLILTPFTVESEDWAYNAVYEYHLSKGDSARAAQTGGRYVQQTLRMFDYIEEMCRQFYGRAVKQIYLCHDNVLNEHYLPVIVRELKSRAYQMISLDEAMADPIYRSEDGYYQKWGISWIYRYNYAQLKEYSRKEPDDHIYQEYQALVR